MNTKKVKDIYNKDVPGKFGGEYEYNRWFKNDIQKAGYEMTLASINKHAVHIEFMSCFELGPGAGTWTDVLIKAHPEARFRLLDISKEMLKLSRERFKEEKNVEYIEGDFLEYNPEEKFDFFFSSRVIEYIPDQERVARQILSLLKEGGEGFLITKTPKYLRNKILKRKIDKFHQGQIEPKKLKEFFLKNGATKVKIYPVAMSIPILNSPFINKLLHKIFYRIQLNPISKFFAESYLIKFVK